MCQAWFKAELKSLLNIEEIVPEHVWVISDQYASISSGTEVGTFFSAKYQSKFWL